MYSNDPYSQSGRVQYHRFQPSGAPYQQYSTYVTYQTHPNGAVGMINPSPTTPFDMQYGKSMLPRQLLNGSPLVASPVTPFGGNGNPHNSHNSYNSHNSHSSHNPQNSNNNQNGAHNMYYYSNHGSTSSSNININSHSNSNSSRSSGSYGILKDNSRNVNASTNRSSRSNRTMNKKDDDDAIIIKDSTHELLLENQLDESKVEPCDSIHRTDSNISLSMLSNSSKTTDVTKKLYKVLEAQQLINENEQGINDEQKALSPSDVKNSKSNDNSEPSNFNDDNIFSKRNRKLNSTNEANANHINSNENKDKAIINNNRAFASNEKIDQQAVTHVKQIGTRSIKIENLIGSVTIKDLLDILQFGPIEHCKSEIIKLPRNKSISQAAATTTSDDGIATKSTELQDANSEIIERENDITSDDVDDNNDETASISSEGIHESVLISITVAFISSKTASKCFAAIEANLENFASLLESPLLSVKPIKSSSILPIIQESIENDGATRAVCVSNIPAEISQEEVFMVFHQFGNIETLNFHSKKGMALIYFTSISSAIKAVEQLQILDNPLSNCKVFYSTDRNQNSLNPPNTLSQKGLFSNNDISISDDLSNSIPNSNGLYSLPSTSVSSPQNHNATIFQSYNSNSSTVAPPMTPIAVQQHHHQSNSQKYNYSALNSPSSNNYFLFQPSAHEMTYMKPYSNVIYSNTSLPDLAAMNLDHSNHSRQRLQNGYRNSNIGNRTVFLGSLHPDTTAEEVCNNVRGGMLEKIRIFPERNICFITFIDANDAAQFFATYTTEPITIHGRRIKLGWGDHSGPLSDKVVQAVEEGGSRNVYIGVITDDGAEDTEDNENDDNLTEEQLKEKTKLLKEKRLLQELEITDRVPDITTLRRDFSVFGEVEQINFFKDGLCAFVNFYSIHSAIKAVNAFNSDESSEVNASFNDLYKIYKISFGKDRCANAPKSKKSRKNKGRKRRDKFSRNIGDANFEDDGYLEDEDGATDIADDDEESLIKTAKVFESIGITSKTLSEHNRLNESESKEEITSKLASSPVLDKLETSNDIEDDDEDEVEFITDDLSKSQISNDIPLTGEKTNHSRPRLNFKQSNALGITNNHYNNGSNQNSSSSSRKTSFQTRKSSSNSDYNLYRNNNHSFSDSRRPPPSPSVSTYYNLNQGQVSYPQLQNNMVTHMHYQQQVPSQPVYYYNGTSTPVHQQPTHYRSRQNSVHMMSPLVSKQGNIMTPQHQGQMDYFPPQMINTENQYAAPMPPAVLMQDGYGANSMVYVSPVPNFFRDQANGYFEDDVDTRQYNGRKNNNYKRNGGKKFYQNKFNSKMSRSDIDVSNHVDVDAVIEDDLVSVTESNVSYISGSNYYASGQPKSGSEINHNNKINSYDE
ncbi:hypothetical protein BVG19_g4343 [[Candida] boidinii]|nr:hypothetical protein BVG19_g4343 [[Candida] boidinii]OWB50376.1 hypothetical protein B5S27_g1926 [[Candida] boidinii]